MPAGPVAADHHLAAAGAAGGVDLRAGDADVFAGHLDGAALGVLLLAGGRKRSGELHGLLRRVRALAGAGGGADHDHAAAPADRVGLDHAGVVDDGVDHLARRGGGDFDPAAVRAQLALV